MASSNPQLLWHQQPWETEAQHQAFTFYRDMPLPRSVDGAYRRYYALKHRLQTGDKQVLKKRAPGGWQNWSRGLKWDGAAQKGATSWEERTRAYDEHLNIILDEELEAEMIAARRALMRDEIRDYASQLDTYRYMVARTNLDKTVEEELIQLLDENGEKTGDTREVITVELNVDDWLKLSKWRQLISQQGRLALKLPDRIQQQQHTGDQGGPIQVEWVDPLDEDDDIGIGADELPIT